MYSYTDENFYTKPAYDQTYPNESYSNKCHKQRRRIEQSFDDLFEDNFGKVCQSLKNELNKDTVPLKTTESYNIDDSNSCVQEDSTEDDRFKNDIHVILKEIESAEDENTLKNLCEIEKDIYSNEAYQIENQKDLLDYFKTINGYYNERVYLLMRHIRGLDHDNECQVNQIVNEQSKLDFYLKNIDKLNDEIDKKNVENLQLNKKVKEFKNLNDEMSESQLYLTQENTKIFNNLGKLETELAEAKFEINKSQSNNLNYFTLLKEEKIKSYVDNNGLEINHLINLETLFLNGLQTVIKTKNNKISDLKETIGERLECQICREKRSTIQLKPCNHQCVCDCCAVSQSHCPFDRTKIESFEKVYIP